MIYPDNLTNKVSPTGAGVLNIVYADRKVQTLVVLVSEMTTSLRTPFGRTTPLSLEVQSCPVSFFGVQSPKHKLLQDHLSLETCLYSSMLTGSNRLFASMFSLHIVFLFSHFFTEAGYHREFLPWTHRDCSCLRHPKKDHFTKMICSCLSLQIRSLFNYFFLYRLGCFNALVYLPNLTSFTSDSLFDECP